MKKLENFIFKKLASYNTAIYSIDKEDVMQEIRIAILTADKDNNLRVANGLVSNLLRDYGFRRNKGKDNLPACPFFDETIEEREEREKKLDFIYEHYVERDLTCKELCALTGAEFSNRTQKLLTVVFPKKEHGGARRKSNTNNLVKI